MATQPKGTTKSNGFGRRECRNLTCHRTKMAPLRTRFVISFADHLPIVELQGWRYPTILMRDSNLEIPKLLRTAIFRCLYRCPAWRKTARQSTGTASAPATFGRLKTDLIFDANPNTAA